MCDIGWRWKVYNKRQEERGSEGLRAEEVKKRVQTKPR